MSKRFFLKLFLVFFGISILFFLPVIFTNKVSAQCAFENYAPPVAPDPAYCTTYFFDIMAFAPCNDNVTCVNTTRNIDTCLTGGGANGTQCCTTGLRRDFCDQRDLGGGFYDFRCCTIPPTPTPTPTPPPPTPTPPPIPCSSITSCAVCTGTPSCGWKASPGASGNFCESGTSSCPVGYSNWYWYNCVTNECGGPPPTQHQILTLELFSEIATIAS